MKDGVGQLALTFRFPEEPAKDGAGETQDNGSDRAQASSLPPPGRSQHARRSGIR